MHISHAIGADGSPLQNDHEQREEHHGNRDVAAEMGLWFFAQEILIFGRIIIVEAEERRPTNAGVGSPGSLL
jgi:hypothetical protein